MTLNPYQVLYFGCWDKAGHHLHMPTGERLYVKREGMPFTPQELDCGIFQPRSPSQDERLRALAYIHGWTVLSMWDRSIDSRGGSHAVFLAPGAWMEKEMWRAATIGFLPIVQRLKGHEQFCIESQADSL